MARCSVIQCVILVLLVGTEAICMGGKDEDFQEFDDDEAEFDFDDPEDRDDQDTYLSDYWCYLVISSFGTTCR